MVDPAASFDASSFASDELRSQHMLLLPEGTEAQDVEALVVTKHPESTWDPDGALRFGRHTTLVGPIVMDAVTAALVDAPAGWPLAYTLRAPVEREDPPMPGTSDPEGIFRAFRDGMPTRAEARSVDLLLAVARRLGGAVRIAGSGVVLRPDPAARVDLVVHSPYWLDPQTLLGVVQQHEPQARLALDRADWSGPPVGIIDEPPDEASLELTVEQRAVLHARADQFDAEALADGDAVDGYGIVADLGHDGRYGSLDVVVYAQEEKVPALAGLEWADRVVSYQVHWNPPEEDQLWLEHPNSEHVAARSVASTAIGLVASAVVEAADGLLLDSDGFIVDRYDL
jgi:hypothetical protein